MSKTEKTKMSLPADVTTEPNNPVVKEANAQKFLLEKLREHCYKLFNVSVSVFDGATSGLSGEFTVEKIEQMIKAWGEKPIDALKKKEVN